MDEEKTKGKNALGQPAESHPVGEHEGKEIDILAAVKWIAGLTAIVLIVMIVSRLIMTPYLTGDSEDRVGTRQYYPPEALRHMPLPQLQLSEPDDLKAWRDHEDSILDSYGWVDKDSQVARVPIARAIDLLLQKGLPSRSNGVEGPTHAQ